ncbi:MAG: helix-turn-helix transcriptional regulator [Candidatus Bathyarchaeota archaeon]|nr:helix-turn-helix domain-containing protein [Candidatus Bathyarchaeum tardum]WGM90255.1 MAG: helix-turn-helix domain-containing protein [Candidatus Bathyarchaeum tardum]WNZ29666.1 MAG: helix-turn-helix transcriptional regulator [Candidatus Bathyarchaeota archaeon]
MNEKTQDLQSCPLDGVIDIISRKWSFLVINTIGNCEKIRFKEILTHLHKLSAKTLSETLKKLHREGLVKREAFSEIPPRVEYSLTEEGISLWKAIIPLLNWTIQRGTSCGQKELPKTCKLSEGQKKLVNDGYSSGGKKL